MSELVEIELPFSGFYESIHDDNITRAIESGFDYNHETDGEQEAPDDIWGADYDYKAICREYCQAYTEAFGQKFELTLSFDEMISPREYNFSTDRIFCKIPKEQIDKIRKEVENHKGYASYIKERFTSYDGFWSNYSSDASHEDWTKDTLDECQYRVILEFWTDNISTESSDLEGWETWLMDDAEMYNWDSVIQAQDKMTEYLKEQEKI